MAKTIYQRKQGGDAIQVWGDGELDSFTRAEIQDQIVVLENILLLSDDSKDEIRTTQGIALDQDGQPLDYFDDVVPDELAHLKDLNDYFDYSLEDTTITGFTEDWFTPVTVEDFPGEDVVGSNLLMIDGVNSTFWEWTGGAPPYSVTFQLRDYCKKIKGIRFRNTDGDLRSSLQNVQVKASKNIGGLDGSADRFTIPFSMTSGAGTDGWQEFDFDNVASNARYVRIEGFDTEHAADQVRIREIAFKVGVK